MNLLILKALSSPVAFRPPFFLALSIFYQALVGAQVNLPLKRLR